MDEPDLTGQPGEGNSFQHENLLAKDRWFVNEIVAPARGGFPASLRRNALPDAFGLMLGVPDGDTSGIGGGCLMMLPSTQNESALPAFPLRQVAAVKGKIAPFLSGVPGRDKDAQRLDSTRRFSYGDSVVFVILRRLYGGTQSAWHQV